MLFFIVVIAIFAGLVTRKARQIRRVERIAVHPRVDELARDRAPARLQRFLNEMEPRLLELGFHAFGGVRRIAVRDTLFWTGVFFINREMGERVSVLSWGDAKRCQFSIGLVTEFTDGHKITTRWTPPRPSNTSATDGGSMPTRPGTPIVVELCAWHRRRVQQAIVERESVGMLTPPGRVLPSPENEAQWIRSIADRMAEQVASSLGWRIGITGRYYEPSWRQAFRGVFGASQAERQPASHGFEVIVTPRYATPLKVDSSPDGGPNESQH